MTIRSKLALLGCTLFAVSALSACGGGDTADSLNLGSAQARFINAAPGSPSLTLYRKGNYETSAGVQAYEGTSKYYDTPSVTSDWAIHDSTVGTVLATTSLNTENATNYTLVALPDGTGYKLMTISDPYDKPVDSNRARVRILNGSPLTGTYDVYITPPGTDLATVSPNMASVASQAAVPASGANSVFIGSGTYQVRLTPAGSKTAFYSASMTVGDDDDELLISLPSDDGLNVQLLDVRHGSTQDNLLIANTL
ncbi:DUF4397 domain-containing protein [Ideonella azotifigens]|uniref:DUF4397 domain-containing protein n=1 Tax=Ideonella azotifigens TaxID=513160 RepID=A0ABN1KF68_9BURK|nr:DUF4397 domain-containing protein [Ideonella azotifigens]MCD2340683.1 DUF4397 domain-containing protein [Ideonella azotifigens]